MVQLGYTAYPNLEVVVDGSPRMIESMHFESSTIMIVEVLGNFPVSSCTIEQTALDDYIRRLSDGAYAQPWGPTACEYYS